MSNASPSASFIFVKSETREDKYPKAPSWSDKIFEKEYESTSDEEKDWTSKEMEQQIVATVSDIRSRPLRDEAKAYVVLGVESRFVPSTDYAKIWKRVFYKNTLTVLERLSAQILCYLNPEHNKLLIGCPLSKLEELVKKEKYSKVYFRAVKRISPLFLGEQISGNLKDNQWVKEAKYILIELIPNLSVEKKQEYVDKLIRDIKVRNGTLAESCYDNDFVIASLNQQSTENLLQASNYVFRVSEIPKGVLQKHELLKRNGHSYSTRSIRGKPSSVSKQNVKDDNLPIVCVLDSGVNEISQLNGILVARDGYYKFRSFDDDFPERGHGTPVAYLSAFGENCTIPRARIVSYKIYSHDNRRLYPDGYRLAIARYSSKEEPRHSRIFVSSIVFENYTDVITASIDRWVQESNICAIFPTGNIEINLVNDYADRRVPCSSYICDYPVQDPAQAVNVLAIGAIAKKDAPNSIVRKNELSPFTRCGCTNSCLYDCQKPEFVQHGGNYCKDGKPLGVESIDKNGERFDGFLGTSFSAPTFACYLAQIMARYGDKFKNIETLKAIAFALSSGEAQRCRGFGEPKPLDDFNFDLQALVCSEGFIPLLDTLSDDDYRIAHTAKVSVAIPKLVNSVKMFIVHSDNHFAEAMPRLNTYLTVKAKKTARDYGYAEMSNKQEETTKTNMKIFKWAYESQSMEGTWDFYLRPQLIADMLAEHRRATTIRYGCAILINSKILSRDESLTQQVYSLNKQLGVIR